MCVCVSSSNSIMAWVQRLFIIINFFFVIVGGVVIIISLALLSPSLEGLRDNTDNATYHIVLYIVGSVTMVLATLGVYGAHRGNMAALTVYLVCLVVGALLMLRAGVPVAAARPQLESLMEQRWHSFLPLDQASDDIRKQAESLQTTLHCCGLFSYNDWEDQIPDSCLCSPEEHEEECETISYKNFLQNIFWKKKSVLKQPCFPLIMVSITSDADITLGVVFTLFALAVLGCVLSSLMIYHMTNMAAPMHVMFADQPPAYQQLWNLPE